MLLNVVDQIGCELKVVGGALGPGTAIFSGVLARGIAVIRRDSVVTNGARVIGHRCIQAVSVKARRRPAKRPRCQRVTGLFLAQTQWGDHDVPALITL